MNTKIRSLAIAALVLALSVMVWSIAAAQDATSTEEPTPEMTAEPMTEPTSMPTTAPNATADRPFLGVAIQDSDQGVLVAQVMSGSPADDAGLKVGDIITAINGTDVSSAQDTVDAVQALHPGDQANVDFTRGGAKMSVTATLGALTPDQMTAQAPMPVPNQPNQPNRGNNNRGNNRMFGLTYNDQDQSWTINNLPDNSPLYDAGLRQGDVITAFDGQQYDAAGLRQYLSSLDNNASVTLTVQRDNAEQDIQVSASDLMTIFAPFSFGMGRGNFPGNGDNNVPFNFQMMPPSMFGYGNGRLGVTFVTLDAQTAQEYNVTATEGALIVSVDPNSPAADAGLQENDIVTAVNNEPVDQERTLRDRLIAYEPGDVVTLTILRDGESQDIQVTMGQPEVSSDMFPGFQFQMPNMPGMQTQPTPQPTPNM